MFECCRRQNAQTLLDQKQYTIPLPPQPRPKIQQKKQRYQEQSFKPVQSLFADRRGIKIHPSRTIVHSNRLIAQQSRSVAHHIGTQTLPQVPKVSMAIQTSPSIASIGFYSLNTMKQSQNCFDQWNRQPQYKYSHLALSTQYSKCNQRKGFGAMTSVSGLVDSRQPSQEPYPQFRNLVSSHHLLIPSINVCKPTHRTERNTEEHFRSQITTQPLSIISSLCRNVESQFKMSQKKEKKYRDTPNRRMLFSDRDTIQSRYNQQASELQVRMQESQICQMQTNRYIPQYSQQRLSGEGWVLYRAFDQSGVRVSIKQMQIDNMNVIANEINIGHQLKNSAPREFLKIISNHIQGESYVLVREPYEMSLLAHLRQIGDNSGVWRQVGGLIGRLRLQGIKLVGIPALVDFVIADGCIVLHNCKAFGLDEVRFSQSEALLSLHQQFLRSIS